MLFERRTFTDVAAYSKKGNRPDDHIGKSRFKPSDYRSIRYCDDSLSSNLLRGRLGYENIHLTLSGELQLVKRGLDIARVV